MRAGHRELARCMFEQYITLGIPLGNPQIALRQNTLGHNARLSPAISGLHQLTDTLDEIAATVDEVHEEFPVAHGGGELGPPVRRDDIPGLGILYFHGL